MSNKRSASGFFVSLGVTTFVVVLPCALSLILRVTGAVTSPVLLILISVALSVAASVAVSAVWKRLGRESEIMFEDLMLWGWIRHRRFDRLLDRAESFVGPNARSAIDPKERGKTLVDLSEALDARYPGTYGHSKRVARHAASMAKRLKASPEEVARIRTAALLHDIGKIETPREIIEKTSSLTDEEYEEVRLHPGAGADLVADLGDPDLAAIVRHHHERFDGLGYPDGLVGEEIPFGARIIAVADTFDALTSARHYRTAMSHERALKLLEEEAGHQLDPEAVAVFEARYGGHRPVAASAALLGLGRQAGQTLAGLGSGATQVAAVGAAATVLGTAPVDRQPAEDVRAVAEAPAARVATPSAGTTTATTTNGTGPAAAPGGRERDGRPGPRSEDGPVVNAPGDNEGPGRVPSGGGNGGEDGGSDDGAATPADPGGPGDPGGSGGDGGGGGGPAPAAPVPAVPDVIPPPVREVIEQVPPVPEQLPGSGVVNGLVDNVKQLPGNVLGGK